MHFLAVGPLSELANDEAAAEAASFLALCSGIVQLIAGLLKLGFIIENILPHSVISGFTSGAAVLIILSMHCFDADSVRYDTVLLQLDA